MASLQFKLNSSLYIKDPQETDLGRKIVKFAIVMIDLLGFEHFTVRKLSVEVGTTEASIYRYFENKHKLLIYIIAWYWNWIEYRIVFETNNIEDPIEKLKICLRIVSEKKVQDKTFPDIDEEALHHIVINESDKTYLTRHVDADNKEGLFRGYKQLCNRIALIVQEINPTFKYPHALVSTVLEAANQQIFFASHLPSLTEVKVTDSRYDQNYDFLLTLVLNTTRQ